MRLDLLRRPFCYATTMMTVGLHVLVRLIVLRPVPEEVREAEVEARGVVLGGEVVVPRWRELRGDVIVEG